MLVEKQQLETAELIGLPPCFELFVDARRDVGGKVRWRRLDRMVGEAWKCGEASLVAQMVL
jgi:hypothetical protein